MKNLLKFFNRSGKIALSALQAGGIAAVVGVAGIAAWQYLGSNEDDNAFNPFQQDTGEVVYVAGANSGGYQSGAYYGNGSAEQNSSFNVSAKALNRLDRQAQAEQAAREMAEDSASIQASSASSDPLAAYETGATEGLGMGSNAANDNNSTTGSNPLAAMSGMMGGNIQDVIAKAQQAQAAAQGGAAGGEAAGAGAPTLASAQANWNSKFGGGSGGSNGFNSSFAVQNSGKNRGKSGGASTEDMARQMADMQAQAKGMLDGSRIRGKSSFGNTDNLGDYRNGSIGRGGRSTKGDIELEQIRKQSADVAANKNRAANEAARPFLASTQQSGGVMVTKDNFEANSSQSSADFNSSFSNNMGNLQDFETDITDYNDQRTEDYMSLLMTWIGVTAGVLGAIWAIHKLVKLAEKLKDIPAYGAVAAAVVMVVALLLAVFAILAAVSLIVGAANYASNYGGGTFSTMAGITGIGLIVGVVASFFLDVFKELKEVISSFKEWLASGKSTSFGEVIKGIWAAIK